jgi:hypothetical protein
MQFTEMWTAIDSAREQREDPADVLPVEGEEHGSSRSSGSAAGGVVRARGGRGHGGLGAAAAAGSGTTAVVRRVLRLVRYDAPPGALLHGRRDRRVPVSDGHSGLRADAFGRRQPFASFGAQVMGARALLWVVGAVVSIGGHRAVRLMTGRGDPIETVNSITWTVDTINDAFELAGSALLGAGMLALACVGMRDRSRGPAWSRYTLAVGLVLLATAGAYAAQSFDLVDVLLVAGGAVLLPLWLVWTGRLLRAAEEPPIFE